MRPKLLSVVILLALFGSSAGQAADAELAERSAGRFHGGTADARCRAAETEAGRREVSKIRFPPPAPAARDSRGCFDAIRDERLDWRAIPENSILARVGEGGEWTTKSPSGSALSSSQPPY